jgi:hypothetical protein
MTSRLHTVRRCGPGRLSTMARPRGGDWLADELAALRRRGVDVLVHCRYGMAVPVCWPARCWSGRVGTRSRPGRSSAVCAGTPSPTPTGSAPGWQT